MRNNGVAPSVRLLGPLQLVVDAQPVPVSRRRVRQALTLLAARSGATVATDEIVEHLWSDALPSDPRSALRVVLSRVRSVLGTHAGALEQKPGGYRLTIATDLAEFHRLRMSTTGAGAAERIERFEEALDLWRGDMPFGEDAHEPQLRVQAQRLIEERGQLEQRLAELLLEQRRPNRVIELLAPRVAAQPHNEGLAMMLARCYAAVGRKSDGLDVLARTTDYLRVELGVDADRQVGDLQRKIMTGAIDLVGTTRAPDTQPRLFVGRDAERTRLVEHTAGILSVFGEPGAGKSALLDEAAKEIAATGVLVVRVAVSATPQTPTEVSEKLVMALIDRLDASRQSPEIDAMLAQVAPQVAARPSAVTLSRDGLIDAVVEVVTATAPHDEVVILLDDAQWLDRLSIEMLEQVIAHGGCRVIAASRLGVPAHVEAFLQGQERPCFVLPALEPVDVQALLQMRAPVRSAIDWIEPLFQRSGGNPFFLNLLVDLLAEGALVDGQLPPTVLVAVQKRLETLSLRARETLRVASVFLEGFSIPVLCRLRPHAEDDLAEAEAAGLVEISRDGTGDFVHQLVAEGAYELLAEGQRVALHDEIGRLLEAEGASPAEYAVHAGQASALDPRRAVQSHRDAAEAFARAFDWDTALAHIDEAQHHLRERKLEDSVLQSELLVREGTARRAIGLDAFENPLVHGAELAMDRGVPVISALALIELCGEGRVNESDPVASTVSMLLDKTLASNLPDDLRAELCSVGSTFFLISDHHERAHDLYGEGLTLARAADDPALEARVLSRINTAMIHPDFFADRAAASQRLREIARRDSTFAFDAALVHLGVAMVGADVEGAEEAITQLRHAAEAPSARSRHAAILRSESSYARFTGDLARAEALANELLQVGSRTVSDQWIHVAYAGLIAAIREAQGRLGELSPLADRLVDQYPGFLPWQMMATACAAAAGLEGRVRSELADMKTQGFGALRHEVSWWAGLAIIAEAIHMVNDADAARMVYDQLLPQQGLIIWNGAATQQPADASLAILASVMGEPDVARSHHETAARLAVAR